MKRKIPSATEQQVANLKDGLTSPFWTTLKQIVVNEKEELEAQILEDEGIDDKTRDDLRRWRNFLTYFVKLPEKCIESLEALPPNDGKEDEDPYEKMPLEEIRQKILKG